MIESKCGLRCGEYPDFVCPHIHTFAYDMEQSDNGAITWQSKKGVKKMASSKEFLQFILEQLCGLGDISYRPMMGEYIIYYRGKIVGGIYDDRLLVKKTKSALELMPAADCDFPYKGAKEILLVDEIDNKEFLKKLFEAMYKELSLRS